MIKIEVDSKVVGKAFGDTDSVEQAAFLNEMGRFSQMICKTESAWESQICYVAEELDKNGTRLVQTLYEFLTLKGKLEE